jgi:hypothetical protein
MRESMSYYFHATINQTYRPKLCNEMSINFFDIRQMDAKLILDRSNSLL